MAMKKRSKPRADDSQRCADLTELLAATTVLGQQLEIQRNCLVRGATSALALLKLAATAGTIEERTEAILAVSRWLAETSANVIAPIPWVGSEQVAKH
ncbi:hypothetical protein [Bradyrhizobium sp. USDA 4454]